MKAIESTRSQGDDKTLDVHDVGGAGVEPTVGGLDGVTIVGSGVAATVGFGVDATVGPGVEAISGLGVAAAAGLRVGPEVPTGEGVAAGREVAEQKLGADPKVRPKSAVLERLVSSQPALHGENTK